MINFVERNSGNFICENKDYEYLNISSQTSDFIRLEDNVISIESHIRTILSFNKTDYDYKIIGIQNTLNNKSDYYVFTNSEEIIDGVKNCLTGRDLYVTFLPLETKIEDIKPSLFKTKCQEWCNKIKEYFEIEYGFYGTIKLTAVKIKERKAFDFTASGKGTTNEVVYKVKSLNKYLVGTNIFYNTCTCNMVDVIRDCLKS